MGKSCVRFKNRDQVPLGVVGETVRGMPVDRFIELYEGVRPVPKGRATKPAKAATKKAAQTTTKPATKKTAKKAAKKATKKVAKKVAKKASTRRTAR